jgi:hypothetical protein
MLSLNLPRILIKPHAITAGSGGRIKRRPSLPKGRPQIGGTMPKSVSRRNAAKRKNRRFSKGFAEQTGRFSPES